MYRYEMVTMKSPFASRNPYGILCREEQSGVWIAAAVVAPFSSDSAAVSGLAEKCTALQLSPEQLIHVVSDFIAEAAMGT